MAFSSWVAPFRVVRALALAVLVVPFISDFVAGSATAPTTPVTATGAGADTKYIDWKLMAIIFACGMFGTFLVIAFLLHVIRFQGRDIAKFKRHIGTQGTGDDASTGGTYRNFAAEDPATVETGLNADVDGAHLLVKSTEASSLKDKSPRPIKSKAPQRTSSRGLPASSSKAVVVQRNASRTSTRLPAEPIGESNDYAECDVPNVEENALPSFPESANASDYMLPHDECQQPEDATDGGPVENNTSDSIYFTLDEKSADVKGTPLLTARASSSSSSAAAAPAAERYSPAPVSIYRSLESPTREEVSEYTIPAVEADRKTVQDTAGVDSAGDRSLHHDAAQDSGVYTTLNDTACSKEDDNDVTNSHSRKER